MPKFLVKRWHGLHHICAFVVMVAMTAALSWLHWLAAVLGLLATIGYGLFTLFAERAFRKDLRLI